MVLCSWAAPALPETPEVSGSNMVDMFGLWKLEVSMVGKPTWSCCSGRVSRCKPEMFEIHGAGTSLWENETEKTSQNICLKKNPSQLQRRSFQQVRRVSHVHPVQNIPTRILVDMAPPRCTLRARLSSPMRRSMTRHSGLEVLPWWRHASRQSNTNVPNVPFSEHCVPGEIGRLGGEMICTSATKYS